MTYNKQTWVDGDKSRPLSAARLAHMETQYEKAMADRAGGVSRNVAGSVSLSVSANYLYELNATSSATVALTGATGTQVAIRWSGVSGTVEGQPVSAGQTWVAVRWLSGWVLYEVGGSGGGGGGSLVAGSVAASAVTSSGFTLTISGASGDLHAQPYAFSTDNGATWSAYQSSPVFVVSGKSSGTAYQCKARVRSTGGVTATTDTTTVTTSAVSMSLRDRLLSYDPQWLFPLEDSASPVVNIGSAGGTRATAGAPTFGNTGMGGASGSMAFPTNADSVTMPANWFEGATRVSVMLMLKLTEVPPSGRTLMGKNANWSLSVNGSGNVGGAGILKTPAATPQHGVTSVTEPYLIGVVYNAGTSKIFVNGALVETQTGLPTTVPDNNPSWGNAIGLAFGSGPVPANLNWVFVLEDELLTDGQMMDAAVSAGVA